MKYKFNDYVKIVSGFFNGQEGVIIDYIDFGFFFNTVRYEVILDPKIFDEPVLIMEKHLKLIKK